MIQGRKIDSSYENNYQRVGSYLDMEIFRNKRIGTYNRESILLNREVPKIDTKDHDYRLLTGTLSPGLSTCTGCTAPMVFNLVAKAAQMRPLFLTRELIKEGVLTRHELERPEVMKILLNENTPSTDAMKKAAIDPAILKEVEKVKKRLIAEGVYFKLIFAGVTGCMTVTTASYPNNIWRFPYFHSAFENIGAVVSGLEAGARSKQTNGMLKTPHKVIGFAGDGGSFDIGLQSLSGIWERNQDCLIITYDNEAYMNTGKQRCSSTPWGASTSTSPVGRKTQGKQTDPKDIISIAISHNIPYVATASPDDAEDLIIKVQKALLIPGSAYLRILAPCPPGWAYDAKDSIKLSKAAVDAASFFSFEVETDIRRNRRYFTINNAPSTFFNSENGREEIDSYTTGQGRFDHMSNKLNQDAINVFQAKVDSSWRNMIDFFGLKGDSTA